VITGADCNAKDAPDGAESHSLHRELGKDGSLGRADGFADSDLTSTLGDGNEHDVHDADAADHQSNRRDGDHEGDQGRR